MQEINNQVFIFFFNDTATTYIYTSSHTLSLHDALPISFTMPCTWWSGRTRRMRSSALHSHAVTSDVTWARRLPCVVTTPLGLPVVPLVYRIMARRSSGTSGSEERGSAA